MNFKEANKDADRIPNVVTVTVLEQGPARVSFKVVQSDRKSTFTNIIALTDGCDIVEVYSEIEWQNLRTLAKNKFSFTAENEKATFDLGLGAIERGNMSEKLFEVPAQKWVDLTDKSGEFGVSVLSECKYGWDKYKDNTLHRSAIIVLIQCSHLWTWGLTDIHSQFSAIRARHRLKPSLKQENL